MLSESLPKWLCPGLLLVAFGSMSSTAMAVIPVPQAALLVADRATNNIFEYNPNTGAYMGTLVSAAGGTLNQPDGMLMLPNNILLVANAGSGYLGDPGTGYISEYNAATGQYLGNFATGLNSPSTMAYYNNTVYVGSVSSDGATENGNTIYTFSASGTPQANINLGSNTLGVTGLAVGADGNLYVGSFGGTLGDGQVLRINPSTQQEILTPGNPQGAFADLGPGSSVGGITFTNNNNILTVDVLNGLVQTINGTTGAVASSPLIPGTDPFPGASLVLPNNDILVASLGTGNVSLYGPSGNLLQENFIHGTIQGYDLPYSASAMLIYNPLPGDVNLTGFVGQSDLNTILANWGQHVPQGTNGDINGDTFIGQADLNVVLGEWGQGTPPGSPTYAVVPEVSSVLMISIMFGSFACIISRRKSSRPNEV